MPTYQYSCTECALPLEAFQSFSDEPITICPACGGRLRKVFNSVGIVFKGSGFYRTDSRAGTGDAPNVKPEPAKAETKTKGTSEGTKSESSSSSTTSSGSNSNGDSSKSTQTKAPAKT